MWPCRAETLLNALKSPRPESSSHKTRRQASELGGQHEAGLWPLPEGFIRAPLGVAPDRRHAGRRVTWSPGRQGPERTPRKPAPRPNNSRRPEGLSWNCFVDKAPPLGRPHTGGWGPTEEEEEDGPGCRARPQSPLLAGQVTSGGRRAVGWASRPSWRFKSRLICMARPGPAQALVTARLDI